MPLTIMNARVLTLRGDPGPRRGADLAKLGIIDPGYVVIRDDQISEVGSGPPPNVRDEEGHLIDAGGSVLMPTFIDCHTHSCWSGSRLDEFEMGLKGASYLDILARGGGIMSTVRAVRETNEEELAVQLLRRLGAMTALGTGTVEVKSGYGLSTASELKMLRAIHAASQVVPQTIVGTFLGAHAIDPDNPHFIEETIQETLPAVAQEFPDIVCDAYCEEGAWSLENTRRLFHAARDLGCPLRIHADQFNSLGMTRLAIEMGAVSVDHLEATKEAELLQLADSSTFGVMLPASGFHLDDRYAAGRQFVDAGGALALATNYNPGSSPTPSMPFIVALACRKLQLTPAEAIACTTVNPACLLGVIANVGTIEVGKRADLQLLDTTDERDLAFEFAGPGPLLVMQGGLVVHTRAVDREESFEEEEESEED